MNADELWETTMDPEHRILLQVTSTTRPGRRGLLVLMGEDVESGATFIQRNATRRAVPGHLRGHRP
jgi:DNA gyrase subunit B